VYREFDIGYDASRNRGESEGWPEIGQTRRNQIAKNECSAHAARGKGTGVRECGPIYSTRVYLVAVP
jgi:hypothetical protein